MTRNTRRRVDINDLVNEDPPPEAKLPQFIPGRGGAVPVEQVAPNPFNKRKNFKEIEELGRSIRDQGQLQACPVVTRDAFLSLFPEHLETIGDARYVQVAGGRRRRAVLHAQLPTLDIAIKESLAESRRRFLAATAEENVGREDLDPIEQASQVEILVAECGGSAKQAALELGKTEAWVSQRRALLSLTEQMQNALVSKELSIRDARRFARLPADEQYPAWQAAQAEAELAAEQRALARKAATELGFTAADLAGEGATADGAVANVATAQGATADEVVVDGVGDGEVPGGGVPVVDATDSSQQEGVATNPGTTTPERSRTRPSRRTSAEVATLAIRRLGGTPPRIAESLWSNLAPEEIKELVVLLQQHLTD
jgi:ParB family chromosome partitioning protein